MFQPTSQTRLGTVLLLAVPWVLGVGLLVAAEQVKTGLTRCLVELSGVSTEVDQLATAAEPNQQFWVAAPAPEVRETPAVAPVAGVEGALAVFAHGEGLEVILEETHLRLEQELERAHVTRAFSNEERERLVAAGEELRALAEHKQAWKTNFDVRVQIEQAVGARRAEEERPTYRRIGPAPAPPLPQPCPSAAAVSMEG